MNESATMADDLELLARAGYPGARLLGRGMESSVYFLTDGMVGKVPHATIPVRDQNDAFDRMVASCPLPFGVPVPIGAMPLADGRTMKVERLLPGRALDDFYDPASGVLDERVIGAIGDVLAGLRELRCEMPAHIILDGERYETSTKRWAGTLVDLGRRRFARFGHQLVACDRAVGRTARDLLTFLAGRHHVSPQIVHGDICGANVLVDDTCRVTAVCDWGFFSVLAEPELDAAIACAVFDMYGPWAAQTKTRLTDAVVARFGFDSRVILAYQGVYALMTSNAYSPDGSDGHFAWCSTMLARPDVQEAAATLALHAGARVEVA